MQNVCANEVQLILLSIVCADVLLKVAAPDEQVLAGVVVAADADAALLSSRDAAVAFLASRRTPSADGAATVPVLFKLSFSKSFAVAAKVDDAVLGILHNEIAGWLGLADKRKYPREDPVSASIGNNDSQSFSTDTKYDGYLNRAVSKTRTIPALGTYPPMGLKSVRQNKFMVRILLIVQLPIAYRKKKM